jgi:hypothetical protein
MTWQALFIWPYGEPCGRHLVSGGTDGCLRAYDLANGDEVGAWRASSDTVSDWLGLRGYCLPHHRHGNFKPSVY